MLILGLILSLAVGLVTSTIAQIMLIRRVSRLEKALTMLLVDQLMSKKDSKIRFNMGVKDDDTPKH